MQVRVERRMMSHVPWGLLLSAVSICGVGIYNLVSASQHRPVWGSQAIYVGLGLLCVVLVSLVDYRFIAQMALPIYVLNIVALLALKVVGHKAKGAESWFALGPVRIQPAEFMKIGMILMLAKFYHDDYRPTEDRYGLVRLWKPLAISLVPFALVLVQPDLGTAMMLFLTAITVILFGRVKWQLVTLLLVGLLGVSAVIWNDYSRPQQEPRVTLFRHKLKRHQDQRIASWLNPRSDLKGANYHTAQSKIAVGSGGLTGRGWMKGTQTGLRFLPEQHTDFIFSVWAEEHGFIFSVGLLVLYGMLLLFSLGVAFTARDRFGAFLAVGVAAMLFWQVFENIGMVIGLMPVTGITLPLLSYGGSSMISVMLSLGLLVNISMRRHMF